MPKLKTRKAASKRYKKTGAGNFLRRHAYKGHLLRRKSNNFFIKDRTIEVYIKLHCD